MLRSDLCDFNDAYFGVSANERDRDEMKSCFSK